MTTVRIYIQSLIQKTAPPAAHWASAWDTRSEGRVPAILLPTHLSAQHPLPQHWGIGVSTFSQRRVPLTESPAPLPEAPSCFLAVLNWPNPDQHERSDGIEVQGGQIWLSSFYLRTLEFLYQPSPKLLQPNILYLTVASIRCFTDSQSFRPEGTIR